MHVLVGFLSELLQWLIQKVHNTDALIQRVTQKYKNKTEIEILEVSRNINLIK